MKILKSFDAFLAFSKQQTSLLLIKEKGCPHCMIAEQKIAENQTESKFLNIDFYSLGIEDDPNVVISLALTGVPAFFLVTSAQRKRLLTGFEGIEKIESFLIRETSGT